MSEHELEHRVELRHRDEDELDADYQRAKRMHVLLAHDGNADACHCELVDSEGHEDIVIVTAVTDVDDVPLGVNPPTRQPITGAEWEARPNTDTENR